MGGDELVAGDGTSLYLRTWTPAAEPIAVACLLHGLGEHSGRYEHVAAALNGAGVIVVAYDMRGHGNSPGKRGHASYEQMLADLDVAIAHTQAHWPGLPLFLYGNSLNGALVVRYAQLRQPPVAGVVSMAPAFRPAFEPPAWKLTIARLLAGVWPSLTLGNELDLEALCRDPEVVAAYRADPLTHDRISARLALDAIDGGETALRQADQLRAPTLILHGSADRLTSCEASGEFAAANREHVEFVELEAFYHEPQNDPGNESVLRRITEWISARAIRSDRAPR